MFKTFESVSFSIVDKVVLFPAPVAPYMKVQHLKKSLSHIPSVTENF